MPEVGGRTGWKGESKAAVLLHGPRSKGRNEEQGRCCGKVGDEVPMGPRGPFPRGSFP